MEDIFFAKLEKLIKDFEERSANRKLEEYEDVFIERFMKGRTSL